MYTLSNCDSNGTLNSELTRAAIDTNTSQVIFFDLAFNTTGMYVLEAQIKSSDQAYDFKCFSYGVMIKRPNITLTVDDSSGPNVVIKFNESYSKVVADRKTEHIKSQFYNCIIDKYGLELTSSISVYEGSVVAAASIGLNNPDGVTQLSSDILSGQLNFGMPYKSVSILNTDVIIEKSSGGSDSSGSGGSSGGSDSSLTEKIVETAVIFKAFSFLYFFFHFR